MITEEQAREMLAIEPAGHLDAHDVLRAARRSRTRRRAWLSAGVATAAAGATAVAVLALPARERTVVGPDATTTPVAGPTTIPIRSFDGSPVTAFVLGSYVDPETSQRHDVVAFFTPRSSRSQVLTLCGEGLRRDGSLVDFASSCGGAALPRPGRYVGARGGPLLFAADAPETALGDRFHYLVVAHEVARGGIYDETGAFHEGRVLGDPSLPARLLVVDRGGRFVAGFKVWDANDRVLEEQHRAVDYVATPSG